MERESYNDPGVAKLMNDAFVPIKVDREERPDIDNYYMKVSLVLTGSGGWPLNVIMTPDKKPFFAGTYFPKTSRFGQIGMMELVPKIKGLWESRHEELLKSADEINAAIRHLSMSKGKENLGQPALKAAYAELNRQYDKRYSGFGNAPKFPSPHRLTFLLRYWKRTGDKSALRMVENTLEAMRSGGMYDQIGFGFHRYSTDSRWHVPHFEKMLYDQALLAMAYLEAYQATGNIKYGQTAREIFTYVLRDMTAPTGGFYSAQDADSEGEEGKFYRWTQGEIRKILGKDETDFFLKTFSLAQGILYLSEPITSRSSELNPSPETLDHRIEKDRQQLFAARKKRIHPAKDDKILTDWNGLMITALAEGAQILHEPKYAKAAEQTADFILKKMRSPEGHLLHRYRGGEALIPAHLDDYAFMVWGLVNLYESMFDIRYLKAALLLNQEMLKDFWDDKEGGLYFTAKDDMDVPVREKESADEAIPSGNSVAMLNLLRLSRLTASASLEEKAAKIGRAFSDKVMQGPSEYTQFMNAVDFGVGPSYEVVIVGDPEGKNTQAMLVALSRKFIPNKVVLLKPTNKWATDIVRLAEFTKYQSSLSGKATAYVCLNHACKQPTTDIRTMMNLLK